MPIQDLVAEHAPSLFRVVARSLASVLRFLFLHVAVEFVLFNLGRAALLVVTFGRYPRGRALVTHAHRISGCGALVIVLAWCAIALFNHFASTAIGA